MPSRFALCHVLMLLALPLLSGCTVIGGFVGNAMEDKTYASTEIKAIPKRASVHVHRRSGAVVTGRPVGYGELSEEAYAAAYAGQREVALPPLGAPVRVDMTSGAAVTGAFQGFVGAAPQLSVLVDEDQADTRPARTIPLGQITALGDEGGTPYDRPALNQLATVHLIPTRSTLVLATSSQEERIPLQEVQRIVDPGRKNATLIGLGIGLALDGIVVYLFAKALENGDWSYSSGSYW